MDKIAQPRWAKEAIKHVENGRFSKANNIVKNVRKAMIGKSTLNATTVMSSKYGTRDNKYLSRRMTLGDERRRLAERKSVKKKLFIKDKIKGQ